MSKEFLKPKELLEKNPGLKKKWRPQDIGYMLSLGLVRGEKNHRTCVVNEKDVLSLFKLSCKLIEEAVAKVQ